MSLSRRRPRPWLAVAVAGAAAFLVAALGATLTDLGPWYQGLSQPAWKPPDFLFGPAWTIIFALVALSAAAGWRAAPNRRSRDWLIVLFCLNGTLNLVWSLLFFRLQRPDWALIEVVVFWLSILWLVVVLRRYAKTASWLLVPYLVWVAFAGVLNLAVVQLNGPF